MVVVVVVVVMVVVVVVVVVDLPCPRHFGFPVVFQLVCGLLFHRTV